MKHTALVAFLALGALCAQAKVTLPQFFTDSMVMQRGAEITIPGTAKKNATIKIKPSWAPASTVTAKADKNGKFKAKLQVPEAPGPYSITITDGNGPAVVLSEILAGDVWLCSGQSNMEMPVEGWGKVMDYRREVANANSPQVRLLQIKKQTAFAPQEDTKINMGGWRSANPSTVGNFSAIGYFFGREINDSTGVPIGVIDCTWGGTPIEAWTSYEALASIDAYQAEREAMEACGFDSSAMQALYDEEIKKWNALAYGTAEEWRAQESVSSYLGSLPTMNVPGAWEQSALPGFDGVVLMQRTVNIPADMAGKKAVVSLAMVDDRDVVRINDTEVGEGSGYNVNRVYTIPEGILKEGENIISVLVTDTGGGGGIWGQASDMWLKVDDEKIMLDGPWHYLVMTDFADLPAKPVSPVDPHSPTLLYNAMAHPLEVLPLKGVLWYQGCSNVGRAALYEKNFKAMIEDWRARWQQPELPFYFVQLAGFHKPLRFQPNSEWALLRQAQAEALSLPATGMAVAIDLGNPDDIHPKNKQEVARRLALLAFNNLYGIPTECIAPVPQASQTSGRYVTIDFDKPVAMPGDGHMFVLQDAEGQWAQGYARQTAPNQIEVSSDDIPHPVAVRYNWADCPDGTLHGLTGLPVAPFEIK